jgi:hypothetical protein
MSRSSGASGSRLESKLSKGCKARDDPVSLSYTCGYCKRGGTLPNPCPKRHRGEHLNFANVSQCLSCRNYQNSCLKHKSSAEIKDELSQPAKLSQYVDSLQQYEAFFDATEPGKQLRNVTDHIDMPKWATATLEQSQTKQTYQGTLWPRSALDREGVAYDEKDMGLDSSLTCLRVCVCELFRMFQTYNKLSLCCLVCVCLCQECLTRHPSSHTKPHF